MVALGLVTTGLVVFQAWLLAYVISTAFAGHKSLSFLRLPLALLVVVVVVRASVAWLGEIAAVRASTKIKGQLRSALVRHVGQTGPGVGDHTRSAAFTILATRGLDALDGYFARYLPQLILAVVAPVLIIAVSAGADWVSAVIFCLTVPLIPVFMALIGLATRDRTDRQFAALQRLGGHFLDVVSGLPTLKIFGRAKQQAAMVKEISEQYRHKSMQVLRLTFLSSLVLELMATLSVAVVAVAVGLRLAGGKLDLRSALFVLVLAPEVYLPLRQLGGSFHASAEGATAATQVFAVLDQPLPGARPGGAVPDPSRVALEVDRLEVQYPGRATPALQGVSLRIEPDSTVALAGPSGCGKSTLLAAMIGLVPIRAGSIRAGGIDLGTMDPDLWRSRVAWVPQRPHMFAATIAENIAIARHDAHPEEIRAAAIDAGLGPVLDRLPQGMMTELGDGGQGLSAGERRRVALARAILRQAPLLLLDEPTADLDAETEALVLARLGHLARHRTVVVVAHRPALLEMADQVVHLGALEAA